MRDERELPSSWPFGGNVSYKHLSKDFKVEQKVFILQVEEKSFFFFKDPIN